MPADADPVEREAADRRLRQAEKMDAVGRLAGGIAHDLNNVLTAVVGYSDVALAELAADHPIRRYIEESRKAAERGAALTRQLLAFGRRQVLQLETLAWNDILAGMSDSLLAGAPPGVTVELRADPAAPRMRADRRQAERIVLNLITNAYEAMHTGGRVTVATGHRAFSDAEAQLWPGLRAGDYAWLAVVDTGVGINPELHSLIFEPFFTTKQASGRPAGLGLSTVYGIVKQLDGYVHVESAVGAGATFTVYMPVAPVAAPQPAVSAPLRPHTGTVLVAEDEASVREPVRRVLERVGYRVFEVADGSAALALVAESQEPIDLLLTDVLMPGMDGGELAKQIRLLRPAVRVLFMSGYSPDAVATYGVLVPRSGFLQKPFSVTELVERVRAAIQD